jgi:hypothetical protein
MKKSFTCYIGDLSGLELAGLESILKTAGVVFQPAHLPFRHRHGWGGLRVETGVMQGFASASPQQYGYSTYTMDGPHFHVKQTLNEFLKFLNQEEELQPCPFCGTKAVLHGGPEWWVKCSKIGVCIGNIGGGCAYKEDAIRLWNTRKEIHEHKKH